MQDQLVTFNTAKLAKEKGLNIFDDKYFQKFNNVEVYDEQGRLTKEPKQSGEFIYAPTQSLLQKWLREKFIIIELSFDTETFGYRIFNPYKSEDYFTPWKWDMWSYEEALEKGLQEALKLIK